MEIPVKLQELINKLPSELKDVAETHIPTLLDMADEERDAIFRKMILGDTAGAYSAIVSKMSDEEIGSERKQLISDFESANEDNIKVVAEMQEACMSILNATFLLFVSTLAE